MERAESERWRAFTLIEVMAVVAIIGLSATIILASISSTDRAERETESSARKFSAFVREAQNYSLTGKQLVSSTDPCRYRVSWSGGAYSLEYISRNHSSGVCSDVSPIVSYPITNGVVLSTSGSFSFSVPHAKTDFFSGSQAAVFSKGGVSHAVCIYPTGRIVDVIGAVCP